MADAEAFVGKFASVDALATRAAPIGEIASLAHCPSSTQPVCVCACTGFFFKVHLEFDFEPVSLKPGMMRWKIEPL